MKTARMVVAIGLGVVLVGCARERPEPGVDTTAMTPTPRPEAAEIVVEVRELTAGLLVEARFRPAEAQRVALTRFPNGTVIEATIERRAGDLVYNYRVRDEQGQVHIVRLNANTGVVIETVHDTAAYRPPQ